MPEEKHVGTGRTNCTSQRPKGIHLLQESRSQRTRDRRYLVGVCIYIRCLRIEPRPAFIDSLGSQRSSPCARQRHCRNSRLILPSKSAHSPMLIDVNFFRVVLYHLSVRSSEGSQRWHEKSGNCRQYDMDPVIAKIDMRHTFLRESHHAVEGHKILVAKPRFASPCSILLITHAPCAKKL